MNANMTRHMFYFNKSGTAKIGEPFKNQKEQKYFKALRNLFWKNQSHRAEKQQTEDPSGLKRIFFPKEIQKAKTLSVLSPETNTKERILL